MFKYKSDQAGRLDLIPLEFSYVQDNIEYIVKYPIALCYRDNYIL